MAIVPKRDVKQYSTTTTTFRLKCTLKCTIGSLGLKKFRLACPSQKNIEGAVRAIYAIHFVGNPPPPSRL